MADSPSVLLLSEVYPPQIGGVARAASRIATGLAGRLTEVHILNLTPDVPPGALQTVMEGPVTVHRLGALRERPDTLQLAADIIEHLHGLHGFQLLHGFYVLHWALTEADVVACVSRDLAAKARALTGREDIRYTPNGVEPGAFRPGEPDRELRRRLFPEADEEAMGSPLLGSIGELRFKKGVHILLEAFRRVREQRPAQLLLVGGARRPELGRYYNLLDICLIPSLWEGMPNSALEAMACECVVVASDAGGLSDVIDHGETGAVLSHHELENLAELTMEVLDLEPAARREMGRKARTYVQTHHSPSGEIDCTLGVYELALEGPAWHPPGSALGHPSSRPV